MNQPCSQMDQTNIVRVLLIGPTPVLINWSIWVKCTSWAQLLPLPLSARFYITAAMDPVSHSGMV